MRKLINTDIGKEFNFFYKSQTNTNIPEDSLVCDIYDLLKQIKINLPIKYYAHMGGGSYETARTMVIKETYYMNEETYNILINLKNYLFNFNTLHEYSLNETKQVINEIFDKTKFPYPDSLKDIKEDVSLVNWYDFKAGIYFLILSPIIIPGWVLSLLFTLVKKN